MKKLNKEVPSGGIDLSNWKKLRLDVFPVSVFMFIGNRKDMLDSVEDAFKAGPEPMDADVAEDWANSFRRSFSVEYGGINGECLSAKNRYGAKMWIVRVDEFSASIDDTAMLSHECLHAALSMLGYLGVSENPPFETLCYLHEAIYKCFLRFSFERKGRLRCHS